MRAISLWQPWATAIAVGAKRIETRGWSTDYRGPLAIHAARRCIVDEMLYYGATWQWCYALAPIGKRMGDGNYLDKILPFGAIVATCLLDDCRPTDSFTQAELDAPRRHPGGSEHEFWTERMMGNFDLGRFGWALTEIRALPRPIPFKGRQGFFSVRDELLRVAA